MTFDHLALKQAMELGMAAIVGVAALALELERLGLSDEHDSYDDAVALRPMVLETVEAARREVGED